ncbi:hypothetical protein Salat_1120700 [Sesamum alatum]|uniref:Myb/SANT-like domain-containing protein n=1 Tax=Sesamum alatum TaxID=300844 RepID=A0AAE1YPL3_9LAMI|nr:hypothetical protein Salat_1120700 [Sesamum alatum]
MDIPTQDTRGRGKNKRKWKYEEDAKLVEALLDMVNVGAYKAENGFKPGYLNYVEEKMQVSLPNSAALVFDPIKKCVTAEKAVWEAYLQSHSTHVIWQNKPFPFYDDLLVIFGKDRATGNNAEGPTDMMEEIQREEVNNDPNNDVETTIENGLEDLDASMPFSPLQSPRTEGIQKKKKRSRSVDNLMIMTEGIKEAASVIGSEIAKASQLFSKAIGV